jgi:hypothetical protein
MTTPLDDMFGGFNDDMDPNAGVNNRPDLGRGLYVLSKYYPKSTTKKGNILVAELLVVTPPPGGEKKPGEMVSVAWFVSDSDMVKRRYEKARAAGFVRALLGLPDKDPNTKQAFDTGPYAAKLCAQHQPGTGRLLTINTEPNGQYRNYRYEHVPNQTPESVKAMRARVAATRATPAASAPVVTSRSDRSMQCLRDSNPSRWPLTLRSTETASGRSSGFAVSITSGNSPNTSGIPRPAKAGAATSACCLRVMRS